MTGVETPAAGMFLVLAASSLFKVITLRGWWMVVSATLHRGKAAGRAFRPINSYHQRPTHRSCAVASRGSHSLAYRV